MKRIPLLLLFAVHAGAQESLEARIERLERTVEQLQNRQTIASFVVPELIPATSPRLNQAPLREFADTRWKLTLGSQHTKTGFGPVEALEYRLNHRLGFNITHTPVATTAEIELHLGGSPIKKE